MNNFVKKIITLCITLLLSTIALKAGEIHEAIAADDLNKVKALLAGDSTLLESVDYNGYTPLMCACSPPRWKGEIVNLLLDKGANVNVRGALRFTPLHFANFTSENDFGLIQRLIDKGADLNVQGDNGITPLHYAALMGNIKVAKLLLDNGAEINPYDKYTGELNAIFIKGTILQVAINYAPDQEMAKYLVERGARLNLKDDFGNTELHLAVLKGYKDLVQLLIKYGSDVNTLNEYNHSALYYAAMQGYRTVADLLISSGANINSIHEANYGKARQLTEILQEGEALLWYLRNGFVVKTKEHLLVFIMQNNVDESPEASLSNGRLNPNELEGQNVTIFINNMNEYRMGVEDFNKLTKQFPDARFVTSFKLNINNAENPNTQSYHPAFPNENFSLDGIQVHTIQALGGGMGYLVESDGVKIFDARQHLSNYDASNQAKYRKEIDFLKSYGPIDIAFLSIHIHGFRVGIDYGSYLYLFDQLSPKAVYLSNANLPELYKKCAEFLKAKNIPVYYPEAGIAVGQRFYFK